MRWSLLLVALVACSPSEDSNTPASTAAGGAAPAAAGAPAGAGSAAGASAVAGRAGGAGKPSAAGGSPSTGGAGSSSPANAGAAAGSGGAGAGSGAAGASGSAAGSGGSVAGSMAAAGASGGAAPSGNVMPSAGCMKMTARPQGGTLMQSDRIYSFPAAYDGKTPMPLLLGLHAAGNPVTQIQNLTKGSKLESEFVRVMPKSAGSAWVYDTDIAKVKGVLDEVLATYCIDQSRMFATGHSSGAQMVVQMLCKGEKRFKAVAPVAASKYCNSFSPVAAMYIQGMMDAQRGGGNGMDVVTMFATSNGCGTQTMPEAKIQGCTSSFDRMQVTPGCVTYQGCKAPTIWCSHNDNGYNNSDGRQHGWPCFASAAIADFFLGLP